MSPTETVYSVSGKFLAAMGHALAVDLDVPSPSTRVRHRHRIILRTANVAERSFVE